MWVHFNNVDSNGDPVTDRRVVTVENDDGELERHEINVASTGNAEVPEHVGRHLIESDGDDVSATENDNESDRGEDAADED